MSNDYKAIIAKVDSVSEIPGADRIQVGWVLGESVVISKDTPVGHVGVFFPPDTQLHARYLWWNNLYRESELNKDQTKKGFFESAGRVRAQPFLGIKSCGYFAELKSLSEIVGEEQVKNLKVGDRIGEVNGIELAKKYINPNTKVAGQGKSKAKKERETPLFVEHVDTEQLKYRMHELRAGDVITIQAKAHGTSGRASHTLVKLELPWWKRAINRVLSVFPTEKWEYVTGSRRVVLTPGKKDSSGFHGSDAYRHEILEQLKPHLNRGITVYYEIVGYVNGKPVMGTHDVTKLKDKDYIKKYGKTITYKYGNPEGQYSFFIYRVTVTTVDGVTVDLTPMQVQKWCNDRGLEGPLELVEPITYDGDGKTFMRLVKELTERPEVLTEDYRDHSHISEGVVVRVDSEALRPKFYKNKSTAFRILEGIFKESNVDVEDSA